MSNRGDENWQPVVTNLLWLIKYIEKQDRRRFNKKCYLLEAIKANDLKEAERLVSEMNDHSDKIALHAERVCEGAIRKLLAVSGEKSLPKDIIEDSESSAADQDLSQKREGGKPRPEPGVFQSSLVDFQDRIILLATEMAKDGEQGIGRLIVNKVCADAVARRVVEAFHRQKKSVDEAIQGLKDLYASS